MVAFDIGSTLVHPDMDVLARIIGQEADVSDLSQLAQAFAYALEADQRALPKGDWAARQGQELLRLLQPDNRYTAATARDLWLKIHQAGGFGSSLYTELDPDAHYVLTALRDAGCCMVAASNSDGTLRRELEQFGLLQYFEHLVDSHDIGFEKPDGRFFAYVLSLFGREPLPSTWYIGNDLVRDVMAPLMAGFSRAVFYDRADAYPKLATANRLTRLREVVPIVLAGQE
jgi:HAD superfamily hydrolase (TIGR01509 family)